jgi:hypothetical protein
MFICKETFLESFRYIDKFLSIKKKVFCFKIGVKTARTLYMINAQYTMNIDNPRKKLKGVKRMKAKGDCPNRVHSDQIVLGTVRQGGWTMCFGSLDHVSSGQRHSKGHQARVHSDQLVLMTARRRLDHINSCQKLSRESWKTVLGSQETYLKTGVVTA